MFPRRSIACLPLGHFIKDCPTNGNPIFDVTRPKRATGIPKAFLKEVAAPSAAAGGATLMMPGGGYATMQADEYVATSALAAACPSVFSKSFAPVRASRAPLCTPSCSQIEYIRTTRCRPIGFVLANGALSSDPQGEVPRADERAKLFAN